MTETLSDARLDELLVATSRTFAVSIPVLADPLRREVTLAYLLFRIGDTFEDAAAWPRARRIEALETYSVLLRSVLSHSATDAQTASDAWFVGDLASENDGYLDLLRETQGVLDAVKGLDQEARVIIVSHALRTIQGMADFARRSDARGAVELHDFADLETYCYTVAGIVGEMLTDLFLHREERLEAVQSDLRSRAPAFGEALQLVNILKDSDGDLSEGRRFLPRSLERSRVFERARFDLEVASQYVGLLQEHGASRGSVTFTALPVLLARRTLDVVERAGPGAKVGRQTVMEEVGRLNERLDQGLSAVL